MRVQSVPKATLGRLPDYLRYLKTVSTECKNISATTVAKALGLGEVQVRKDLASVSGDGKPKIGYVTDELIEKLEECLGQNNKHQAVIVGAGKPIYPMNEFEGFCYRNDIKIGIITVPKTSAQEVADRMVRCNLSAIWSFAPVAVKVPDNVLIEHENLALSLAHLDKQI